MDDVVTLRPPPVCTGRDGRWLRKEWEPPTLLAALSISTRRSWRLLDGLLPLRRRAIASAGSLQPRTSRRVLRSVRVQLTGQKWHVQKVARDADRLLFCLALAGCGRRCAILSRWTAQLDISHRHSSWSRLCLAYDSRLRTSPRPRGLWASMRHPVCIGQKGVSSRHRESPAPVDGARVWMEIAHSLDFSMKFPSPGFTGVLLVSLSTESDKSNDQISPELRVRSQAGPVIRSSHSFAHRGPLNEVTTRLRMLSCSPMLVLAAHGIGSSRLSHPEAWYAFSAPTESVSAESIGRCFGHSLVPCFPR